MPLTADFEKGTNGATIATTDAGSLTAWDVVSGTPTYDTTHVAHGTLAASEASNARPSWTTALGTITADYGRLYIYPTAFTSAAFVMRYSSNPISSTYFNLKWNDTLGHLNVLNGATGLGTFTNAVVANQWNRIEWHVVFSTTGSGLFEVKLFTSLDSATATETKTFSSLTTSTASAAGWEPLTTNGTTVWYDQIVAGASTYPGPFPVNSVAPTVSGSTPVGSTLTANAGTWNNTFTLSYQWQRDGVNIGGATGTTYVTQAADSGHAVGVVETATGTVATNESASRTSSNTVTPTSASGTYSAGFARDTSGHLVRGSGAGTRVAGFLRASNGGLLFGSTAPLHMDAGYLRDANWKLVESSGAGTWQEGFLRASNGALVTVSAALASAPVTWVDGFLRDATGALVTDT